MTRTGINRNQDFWPPSFRRNTHQCVCFVRKTTEREEGRAPITIPGSPPATSISHSFFLFSVCDEIFRGRSYENNAAEIYKTNNVWLYDIGIGFLSYPVDTSTYNAIWGGWF
ncbi:hypothetical protein R6Q59_007545 [Mikania micrantha]